MLIKLRISHVHHICIYFFHIKYHKQCKMRERKITANFSWNFGFLMAESYIISFDTFYGNLIKKHCSWFTHLNRSWIVFSQLTKTTDIFTPGHIRKMCYPCIHSSRNDFIPVDINQSFNCFVPSRKKTTYVKNETWCMNERTQVCAHCQNTK